MVDAKKIEDWLEKMKLLHKKMFSLSPHLTVCSPDTQLIKDFIVKHPLKKRELKLLTRYMDESTVSWNEIEAEGPLFEEAFRKRWLSIFDELLINTQKEVWDHKWPRLNYHMDDLKQIPRDRLNN